MIKNLLPPPEVLSSSCDFHALYHIWVNTTFHIEGIRFDEIAS